MTVRLKPLNDVIFKKLFGEEDSLDFLEGFLTALLGFEVTDLLIESEKLSIENINDKQGILDIKATMSQTNEKINIEVQLSNQHNMIERTLFYWSKLYTENFKKGEDYTTLTKTIAINILNFDMLPINNFHSKYQLFESQEKTLLTKLLELHFIEYPKFKKYTADLNNTLHRWLLFLQEDVPAKTLEEVIEMDKTIAKAESKLKRLSADEETKRMYDLREKFLSDTKTQINGEKREIAKKLLKKYKAMSISDVAEMTDLPIEQIERLEREVRP
ncbi:Rpn family recombination-promoting nuclease/putative transposase [Bacillus cereus group sp. BfR-BA-01328]|uniref:Rpn family recombination-promoting nuclease/putative transposase n=1 Tax=Bacillus cereus group sp. BfR-BA-01328 TaxID=2920304 RepID=UPI001F585B9A